MEEGLRSAGVDMEAYDDTGNTNPRTRFTGRISDVYVIPEGGPELARFLAKATRTGTRLTDPTPDSPISQPFLDIGDVHCM